MRVMLVTINSSLIGALLSQKTSDMHSEQRTANRTILLNMLAEFIGSAIYSTLYFVLIGRFVSSAYELGYVALAYGIGLAYFAAVYIPFHTYRIHILPFITLITALRKRQWRLIWHKVPAQMLGAMAGVLVFLGLDGVLPFGDYSRVATLAVSEPLHVGVLNGLAAAVICYVFYLIRNVFKQRAGMGTLLLSLLIASLYLLTGSVQGVSALNPFGILSLKLLGGGLSSQGGVFALLLIHALPPVAMTALAFYIAKTLNGKRANDRQTSVVSY